MLLSSACIVIKSVILIPLDRSRFLTIVLYYRTLSSIVTQEIEAYGIESFIGKYRVFESGEYTSVGINGYAGKL